MPKTFREALTLLIVVGLAPTLFAAEHVVVPAELHQKLMSARQARESNIARIEHFLSNETVSKALSATGMNTTKVQLAVSQLGDQELAKLAARTSAIERDFAAGALTNQQITYILIALAAAVITLILVN